MHDLEDSLRSSAADMPSADPPAGVLAALGERAQREGLLDVAYAQADSPFGPLTVAATEVGLIVLAYPERPLDEVLGRLARDVSPRLLEAPARLDPIRQELEEYFAGRLRRFESPIDWRLSRGYYERVLRETAALDYGETLTYGQMADRVGNPAAVRATGSALGSNPIPVVVPCHRILAAGGGLGGYTGGLDRKRFLLELERSPDAQLSL